MAEPFFSFDIRPYPAPESPPTTPVRNNWKGIGDRRFAEIFSPGSFVTGSGSAAWTGDRYIQVLRYTGWSYIAIRAVCECFAGLTAQVGFLRREPEAIMRKSAGKSFLPMWLRTKAIIEGSQKDEIEEAPYNHRLVHLLRNPNSHDVAWTFWFRTLLYAEVTGNAYWRLYRNAYDQVVQMYVIPSHWVYPGAGVDKLVDYYDVRPFGGYGGARSERVQARDMIHFAYPGTLSIIDGWSPLQAVSLWLDVSQSIDVSRLAAMKRGIKTDLILSLDPDFGSPKDAIMDRMQERVEQRNAGETNSGRPLLLEGGVTPHEIGRTPAEMDYVNSSDQVSRDWTMAAHRVGKAIAGLSEEVNFASFNAALHTFINLTMKPKLALIGQVATKRLAVEFDPSAIIFWVDPAPVDPEQQNRDLQLDLSNGVRTINETRRLRGLEPYPHGGNNPMLPAGIEEVPWQSGKMETPQPEPEMDDIEAPEDIEDEESIDIPEPSTNGNGKHMPSWYTKVRDASGHEHDESGRFGSGSGGKKPEGDEKPESGESSRPKLAASDLHHNATEFLARIGEEDAETLKADAAELTQDAKDSLQSAFDQHFDDFLTGLGDEFDSSILESEHAQETISQAWDDGKIELGGIAEAIDKLQEDLNSSIDAIDAGDDGKASNALEDLLTEADNFDAAIEKITEECRDKLSGPKKTADWKKKFNRHRVASVLRKRTAIKQDFVLAIPASNRRRHLHGTELGESPLVVTRTPVTPIPLPPVKSDEELYAEYRKQLEGAL